MEGKAQIHLQSLPSWEDCLLLSFFLAATNTNRQLEHTLNGMKWKQLLQTSGADGLNTLVVHVWCNRTECLWFTGGESDVLCAERTHYLIVLHFPLVLHIWRSNLFLFLLLEEMNRSRGVVTFHFCCHILLLVAEQNILCNLKSKSGHATNLGVTCDDSKKICDITQPRRECCCFSVCRGMYKDCNCSCFF